MAGSVRVNPRIYRSHALDSLDYRLKEFLPIRGRPAVLLNISAGLSLGALHGFRPDFTSLDGLVAQLQSNPEKTG
jgi:hypothetical protein